MLCEIYALVAGDAAATAEVCWVHMYFGIELPVKFGQGPEH